MLGYYIKLNSFRLNITVWEQICLDFVSVQAIIFDCFGFFPRVRQLNNHNNLKQRTSQNLCCKLSRAL